MSATLLREQHHHLTLVHETLPRIHLTLHVPAVVTVADVDPADVRGLRTVDVVRLLGDQVRVRSLRNVRLEELARLIRSLSVDVTNDDANVSAPVVTCLQRQRERFRRACLKSRSSDVVVKASNNAAG